MQNLFTRALEAHQTRQNEAAQEREAARGEFRRQRDSRLNQALVMTAEFVANILGVGPASEKISVIFDTQNSLAVLRTEFQLDGADFEVKFNADLFELNWGATDYQEMLAGRRCGLVLFFKAPDNWCHVPSLEALGERLSRPDCSHLKRGSRDE